MNLKTGYEKLDSIIGGLNEKDLIVIASRPGVGKSTLAYNIANSTSKEAKGKILYFTLEASKSRLKEKITSENVEIIDNSNITVEEIKSKCEEVAKNSLSLAVIDYIQLVSTTSKNEKVKDTDYIYSELKELAANLNIPIIVLSQLTRQQAEKLEDDVPKSFDYQDNSPLLQVADKVILLYRESYYNSNEKITSNVNNGIEFKKVKTLNENTVIAIME